MSKINGPFALTVNTETDVPSPFQGSSFAQAVQLGNISPYLCEVIISNKQYWLAPNTSDMFPLSPNVQSVAIVPQALSGTVPSGSNSDIIALWYDDTDVVDPSSVLHPVPLQPNAVASGSTITGNVDITAPVDGSGNVKVGLETSIPAGSNDIGDVNVGSYAHISTNTTTVVKATAGVLHKIVINNPGTAWTITVYDNTTATAPEIAVATPSAPGTLEFDCRFTTGLTIVTAGTAVGDITVVYE